MRTSKLPQNRVDPERTSRRADFGHVTELICGQITKHHRLAKEVPGASGRVLILNTMLPGSSIPVGASESACGFHQTVFPIWLRRK